MHVLDIGACEHDQYDCTLWWRLRQITHSQVKSTSIDVVKNLTSNIIGIRDRSMWLLSSALYCVIFQSSDARNCDLTGSKHANARRATEDSRRKNCNLSSSPGACKCHVTSKPMTFKPMTSKPKHISPRHIDSRGLPPDNGAGAVSVVNCYVGKESTRRLA
jgi:hypothetical protein